MAKVTEQDLKDLGFRRRWYKDKSGYWFEKNFRHKVFKTVGIHISRMETVYLSCGSQYTDHANRPLTHANLDLFIRFAEGRELC